MTTALGSSPKSLQITSYIELPKPGNASLGIIVNYKISSTIMDGDSMFLLVTKNVISGEMQTTLQSSFSTIIIDIAPVAIDFSPTISPTTYPSVSPSRLPVKTPWRERFNLVVASSESLVKLQIGNWLFVFLVFTGVTIITILIFWVIQYIVDRPYVKISFLKKLLYLRVLEDRKTWFSNQKAQNVFFLPVHKDSESASYVRLIRLGKVKRRFVLVFRSRLH